MSERLGIPIDNVSIVHGDTDKVQFGMGTYGSRSGAVGMSAIVKALDKVEAKAKKVAAFMLEAAEGDIEFKDGKFTVAGTDKSAAGATSTLNAYIAHKFTGAQLEPGLKEGAFYDPTNFTFPAGCHICEVEIDPDTGHTEIVGWTAVDDFGTVINPMIVEGQVHGGVAQGVGQALLEGAVYDTNGQLVSGSFMDYSMPRAENFPTLKVDTTVTKCPSNPLGIKGCGEAGAIAAPAAVINAITDAIGSEDLAMPATPRRSGRRSARPRRCNAQQNRDYRETTMYEFKYHRPTTVRQAANLLAKDPEAKLLAGGHSLLPVMKLRLAKPTQHLDLGRIEGLNRHRAQGPFARDRRDDAPRRGGELAGREGGAAGAGQRRRRDRRSAGAPSRHHRRLARQQRSERRLSGGGARPRRHHHHQQAPHRGRRFLQGHVRRPRSSPTRSSPR